MCVTLYLRYLNDDAIHYNLASYATWITFYRLCRILYIHVVISLLSSTVKRLKLMPLKILMCPELNETIIHQLLERFPKLPCPYLCFIVYLNLRHILLFFKLWCCQGNISYYYIGVAPFVKQIFRCKHTKMLKKIWWLLCTSFGAKNKSFSIIVLLEHLRQKVSNCFLKIFSLNLMYDQ